MKESQCRFLERSVEQVKKELEAANNEVYSCLCGPVEY